MIIIQEFAKCSCTFFDEVHCQTAATACYQRPKHKATCSAKLNVELNSLTSEKQTLNSVTRGDKFVINISTSATKKHFFPRPHSEWTELNDETFNYYDCIKANDPCNSVPGFTVHV